MKPRLGSHRKPFVSLWKEFVGISFVFLLFVIEKEDPIGFSWFCAVTFSILRTLLLEVSGVVPFCVCV